jgi:hypothetical protein
VFYIVKCRSIRHLAKNEGIQDVASLRHLRVSNNVQQQGHAFALNTYDGLSGEVIPALYDASALMTALQLPVKNLSQDNDGTLWLNGLNQYHAVFRVRWAAVKAELETGLYADNSGAYPLYYQVVEDDKGQRWQQTLYPSVADMQGLQANSTAVQLDEFGILQFSFNGQNYRGMLNYLTVKQPASGVFNMITTGDLDGDNRQDYQLYYPSGYVQNLMQR